MRMIRSRLTDLIRLLLRGTMVSALVACGCLLGSAIASAQSAAPSAEDLLTQLQKDLQAATEHFSPDDDAKTARAVLEFFPELANRAEQATQAHPASADLANIQLFIQIALLKAEIDEYSDDSRLSEIKRFIALTKAPLFEGRGAYSLLLLFGTAHRESCDYAREVGQANLSVKNRDETLNVFSGICDAAIAAKEEDWLAAAIAFHEAKAVIYGLRS